MNLTRPTRDAKLDDYDCELPALRINPAEIVRLKFFSRRRLPCFIKFAHNEVMLFHLARVRKGQKQGFCPLSSLSLGRKLGSRSPLLS